MLGFSAWMCIGVASLLGATVTSVLIPDNKVKDNVSNKDNNIVTHKELKSLKGDDGFVISQNIQYSIKSSTEHVLVLGPTGIGKTSRVIKHNIARLKNCSIVCTDPSRDIQRDVKRNDFTKIVFNPLNPKESIGFNPLSNCKTTTEVREVMETLLFNGLKSTSPEISSDFQKWAKLSLPLLNVYTLYNYKYKKYSFGDMLYRIMHAPIIQFKDQMIPKEINGVMQMARTRVLIKDSLEYEIRETQDSELICELESFLQTIGTPECLANIRLTLSSGLALFKDKNVRELCNRNPFSYEQLRHKPYILYIQIPEKVSEFYFPITSVMIKQIMDVTMEQPNGLPIMFVLDELCNIGMIPRFDKVLSTVRRYNIGVLGCTQSLSQLEDIYGSIRTKTILENFNTRVALGGLGDSSDYFSKLLGFTVDDNDAERVLMQPSQIRMLNTDHALIIYRNKRGVIDKMLKHFKK